uniref:DDB1 and CUL4 associated factor 11 n=1 Tax=Gallus gallus TaxID=9031 RepID=A0A8V0XLV0_CHICK
CTFNGAGAGLRAANQRRALPIRSAALPVTELVLYKGHPWRFRSDSQLPACLLNASGCVTTFLFTNTYISGLSPAFSGPAPLAFPAFALNFRFNPRPRVLAPPLFRPKPRLFRPRAPPLPVPWETQTRAAKPRRSPLEPSDDDSDDVTTTQAPPPALWNHELRAELELLGGRGLKGRSLPRLLRQREWGRCRGGSFSGGERALIGERFLPTRVAAQEVYPQKAFCAVFSSDGNLLVSACQDQWLRVYSCRGSSLRALRCSRGRDVGWAILDVVFSPDASQCLYSSWSDYVHVFDIYGDGDQHTALDLRPEERRFAVFSLAMGPDGREVWGGANDGCLYGYDREVQRRVLRVAAHDDDVNAVAVGDAGGQLVVTGGDDAVCRLWDRRCLREERPREVAALAGHRDGVTFIHPRGDGRYLVSNSKDQTAKLWDLRRPAGPGGVAAARRAVARQSWDYRWQRAPRRAMATTPLPGDAALMTYRGHAVLHTLIRCRLAPPPGSDGGLFLGTGCASGAVIGKGAGLNPR